MKVALLLRLAARLAAVVFFPPCSHQSPPLLIFSRHLFPPKHIFPPYSRATSPLSITRPRRPTAPPTPTRLLLPLLTAQPWPCFHRYHLVSASHCSQRCSFYFSAHSHPFPNNRIKSRAAATTMAMTVTHARRHRR